jgi:hypothetical protein
MTGHEFMSTFGGGFDRESKTFDKVIPAKVSSTEELVSPFSLVELARWASKLVQFVPGVDDDITRLHSTAKWQADAEGNCVHSRYFCRSSEASFVLAAWDLGMEYASKPLPGHFYNRRAEFWEPLPVGIYLHCIHINSPRNHSGKSRIIT